MAFNSLLCLVLAVATVQFTQGGYADIKDVLDTALKRLQDVKYGSDSDRPILSADQPIAFMGNLTEDIRDMKLPTKLMVFEFDKKKYNTYENMLNHLSTSYFAYLTSDLNVKRSDKFIRDIDDWKFGTAPEGLKKQIGSWIQKIIGKKFAEEFHLDAKNNGFFIEFIAKVLTSMDSKCRRLNPDVKIRGLVQIPIVVYPTLDDDHFHIYKITIDAWVGCQLISNEGGLIGDVELAEFGARKYVVDHFTEDVKEKFNNMVNKKYEKE